VLLLVSSGHKSSFAPNELSVIIGLAGWHLNIQRERNENGPSVE